MAEPKRTIRVSDANWEWWGIVARRRGQSISAFVCSVIETDIRRHRKGPQTTLEELIDTRIARALQNAGDIHPGALESQHGRAASIGEQP